MRIPMLCAAFAVLVCGCGSGPAAPTPARVPTTAVSRTATEPGATAPAPSATVAPPAADATIPTVEAMSVARTELPASPTPALPSGVVAAIDVGGNAFGTAADRDSLWVSYSTRIGHIDTRTNKITRRIELGPGFYYGLEHVGKVFWVSDANSSRVYRVEP